VRDFAKSQLLCLCANEVVARHHLPILINHEGCVASRTGRGVDADVVCGIPSKCEEILALEVKSDNVVVGGMVAQKRHLGIGPIREAATRGGRRPGWAAAGEEIFPPLMENRPTSPGGSRHWHGEVKK
jgi:hypothetical protein